MSGPLAGVRVLDLTRIMAGPWATQIFADLGADVIKIERPGVGDDTRSWGPPFTAPTADGEPVLSGYFLCVNRGKRSVQVDLATAEGQAVVRSLAERADVVIENYKVGTLRGFGLDYDSVRVANPGVVYCSVTGFGQEGPRRAEPAYDFMIQAMCGLMSVTGHPESEPQKVGVPIIDLSTGLYASIAVLAALVRRAATGAGDYVDLAMLDVGVSLMSNQAMNYLLTGCAPSRTGNAHPNIQPQDVFAAQDGYLAVVVGNDGQFARLAAAIGRRELATDQRFATNADRVANRVELKKLIEKALAASTSAEVAAALSAAGVPVSPINDLEMVFREEQVVSRGLLSEVRHPTVGPLRVVAGPIRYREATTTMGSPPALGGSDADAAWR